MTTADTTVKAANFTIQPVSEPKRRDCIDEKEKYDQCFRNWYRYSYLRKDFEDPCTGYFHDYSACLKKSLEAKGLDGLLNTEDPIWKYDM